MSGSPPHNASKSPPTSPRRAPSHRGPSDHAPLLPSRLRKSVAAAADHPSPEHGDLDRLTPLSSPLLGTATISMEPEPIDSQASQVPKGSLQEAPHREADARTRLLENYHKGSICGASDCNHGTFSPHIRPEGSISSKVSVINDFGGRNDEDIDNEDGGTRDRTRGWIGDTFADGLFFGGSRREPSMSTTKRLATKHGVKNRRAM